MKFLPVFLALLFVHFSAHASIQFSEDGTRKGQFRKVNLTDGLAINDAGDISVTDLAGDSLTVTNAATIGKGAGTGYLSLKGHGGSNNEELIIDLESNANSAVIRTGSTGLDTLTFSDLKNVFYQTADGPAAVLWGYSDKANIADIEDGGANSWSFITDVGSVTLVERDYMAFFHFDLSPYAKRATGYAVGLHGNGQRGFVAEMSGSTSTARTPVSFLSKDKNSTGTGDHFRATNTATDVFKVDHNGSLYAASINGTRIGPSSAADATFTAATVTGNLTATATLTTASITNAVFLTPIASAPTATSGAIYMDSTPNPDELCYHDGAAWQALSGTDANCA